jgi:hypothetical protein
VALVGRLLAAAGARHDAVDHRPFEHLVCEQLGGEPLEVLTV